MEGTSKQHLPAIKIHFEKKLCAKAWKWKRMALSGASLFLRMALSQSSTMDI